MLDRGIFSERASCDDLQESLQGTSEISMILVDLTTDNNKERGYSANSRMSSKSMETE